MEKSVGGLNGVAVDGSNRSTSLMNNKRQRQVRNRKSISKCPLAWQIDGILFVFHGIVINYEPVK